MRLGWRTVEDRHMASRGRKTLNTNRPNRQGDAACYREHVPTSPRVIKECENITDFAASLPGAPATFSRGTRGAMPQIHMGAWEVNDHVTGSSAGPAPPLEKEARPASTQGPTPLLS